MIAEAILKYLTERVPHLKDGSNIKANLRRMMPWYHGKTLDQAALIKNTEIAEELALPPVKIHCSILAEDAIKAAVEDYRRKHGDAGVTAGDAVVPQMKAA